MTTNIVLIKFLHYTSRFCGLTFVTFNLNPPHSTEANLKLWLPYHLLVNVGVLLMEIYILNGYTAREYNLLTVVTLKIVRAPIYCIQVMAISMFPIIYRKKTSCLIREAFHLIQLFLKSNDEINTFMDETCLQFRTKKCVLLLMQKVIGFSSYYCCLFFFLWRGNRGIFNWSTATIYCGSVSTHIYRTLFSIYVNGITILSTP